MQDVSKLTGVALDYAVALALGTLPASMDDWKQTWPHYSTNWAAGGLILDASNIQLCPPDSPVHRNYGPGDSRSGMAESGMWTACTWSNRRADGRRSTGWGETALVAAMRCFVRLKLGDTVVIPQEVLDASR